MGIKERLRLVTAKFIRIVYWLISCAILLAGLIWCFIIFEEVIDKGRFPIESDPRFLKGMLFEIGIKSAFLMIYGSLFWLIMTPVLYLNKATKPHFITVLIGLAAVLINVTMIYLMFFSECGQWILD